MSICAFKWNTVEKKPPQTKMQLYFYRLLHEHDITPAVLLLP